MSTSMDKAVSGMATLEVGDYKGSPTNNQDAHNQKQEQPGPKRQQLSPVPVIAQAPAAQQLTQQPVLSPPTSPTQGLHSKEGKPKEPSAKAGPSEKEPNTTIFVGSIPFEATEADIRRYFGKCGNIVSVKLLYNPSTGRFKGSSFIRFDTIEAATKACAINGENFMGRDLYISMSTSKPTYNKQPPPDGCKTVFVGSLETTLEEEAISGLLLGCGEIVNIKLIKDKFTGQSKGFAFVEFATEVAANNAVELNGTTLAGRSIKIDYQRPRTSTFSQGGGGSGGSSGSGRGYTGNSSGFGRGGMYGVNYNRGYAYSPYPGGYGYPPIGYSYPQAGAYPIGGYVPTYAAQAAYSAPQQASFVTPQHASFNPQQTASSYAATASAYSPSQSTYNNQSQQPYTPVQGSTPAVDSSYPQYYSGASPQ